MVFGSFLYLHAEFKARKCCLGSQACGLPKDYFHATRITFSRDAEIGGAKSNELKSTLDGVMTCSAYAYLSLSI